MKSLFRLAVGIAVMVAITRATGGTRWLNARDHSAAGSNPLWLTALCAAGLLWFYLKDKKRRT